MGLKFSGLTPATLAMSKAAGEHIFGVEGTNRRRVYVAIKFAPHGKTDEELQLDLDLPGNTERPRRLELQEKGAIKDSGMRRKTVSGEWAIVWVRT